MFGEKDQTTFAWVVGRLTRHPRGARSRLAGVDNNPQATVAIARLTDIDRYVGGNPAVTTAGLNGLAEYTNANFFSEDQYLPRTTSTR